jgi:hypothetical protein
MIPEMIAFWIILGATIAFVGKELYILLKNTD